MQFGMSRRIKLKYEYVHISMKESWRNLQGPPKKILICGATYSVMNLVGRK